MEGRIIISTAVGTLLSVISAAAAQGVYSYAPAEVKTGYFGYDKTETYDVAIRVKSGSLKGSKVTGLKVELPGGESLTDVKGWLSGELKLVKVNGKYVNSPDITVESATVSDGTLSVTFAEPYTVTDDFYAGYSFTVSTLDDDTSEPVIITDGDNADGLYIHSSRTKLKWGSAVQQAGGVSTLSVLLDGDFSENSASFAVAGSLFGSVEQNTVVGVELVNYGLNEVRSIAYSYTVGESNGTGSVELPQALDARLGASAVVFVDLGKIGVVGDHELRLEVTGVNGCPNKNSEPSVVMPLKIYPFVAVNRPLVEEYTGLWCGWCPNGYVAMETMREDYPDRFVGIAYHDSDAMTTGISFPNSAGSYPAGFINRGSVSIGRIYTLWPQAASVMVKAGVECEAEWADDTHAVVNVEASVRYMEDENRPDHRLEYVLVADGLSDPAWGQKNEYAPEEGEEPKDNPDMPGELGKLFTHGAGKVYGLTFNDVALGSSGAGGVKGSVPQSVKGGETYKHNYSLNISDLSDTARSLIEKTDKIRVVAILVDADNRPVNCATSEYLDGDSGIPAIESERRNVVSTRWYDMSGREMTTPVSGVNIRLDRYDDGTVKATKVLR